MRSIKIVAWLFFGLLMLTIIPMVHNVSGASCYDIYDVSPPSGSGTLVSIENKIYSVDSLDSEGWSYRSEAFEIFSISFYIKVTTASHKVKCALYTSSIILSGQTEEKIVPVYTGWVTFNFTVKDYGVGLSWYNIAIWSNATTGDCQIYRVDAMSYDYIYYQTLTYTGNFPNPYLPLFSQGYSIISYFTIRDITPLTVDSVYPVSGSYTYPSVTLSYNCSVGGKTNVSLYKKVGAGSFSLSNTDVIDDCDVITRFSRWFSATSLNTLYTWKVSLKNYTFPILTNYSYTFYINESTVHLSDTKTNVAGTLTSIRNNTGFWISSVHNSSITKKDRTVNSSLVHVSYWVVNTWVDYANSTGTTTPFTYHNNTINVSSVKQLKLLSNGYHLWDNSSSGIMSYTNFINCSGTLQKAWYSSLGKFKVWANITGNASANITGNYTAGLNFTGFNGYIVWSGDHIENNTNISFLVTSNMSINGSVHVDEEAYFLSGMLSFDPAVMILSLFFGFFYIGYESKKRSGGFFMLFAGFLLIALGILVYGMLGYAAALVVPFAIFIMLLGGKKAFYGPEAEEPQGNKPTK